MEALKIIKRLASYGVFVAAATLFLVNMVTVALAPYIEKATAYENSYLAVMYAIVSLGVLLLFQLLVIGKPKEIEETIYPWTLIVLFAAVFFVSAFVLGRAIVACSEDHAKNVAYAVAGMIPTLVLSVSEMSVGFALVLKKKKCTEKQPKIDGNGVNLTKEEE